MARDKSLKSLILEQVVSDNVDVVKGRPPSGARRLHRSVAKMSHYVRRVSLFLVLIAVLALSQSYRDQVARMDEIPAQTADALKRVRLRSGAMLSPAQILAQDLTFPAPVPVDRSVFALEVKRVVVDPGHGGDNLGTSADSKTLEKDITLDIGRRLGDLLRARDFQVVLTRETDDNVSLYERAELANRSRGDIFVSIHLNWLADQTNWGVETYYVGPTDDPYLSELAAQENLESGYSLADLRSLLQNMYTNVRQEESRRLGEAVQQGVLTAMREVNPTIRDRGVKKAPFVVLIGTDMPAILAEVSCLSDGEEVRRLSSPEHRQLIAESLLEGIESYSESLQQSNLRGS